MNLIYICVFYQETYIDLLKLLIQSISIKGCINKDTTHILIITSPNFLQKIQTVVKDFILPIKYFILDLTTLMEASCCKLNIFDYEEINLYNKIIYLDTDVLINNDLNLLFNIDIENNKLYALEEETINGPNHGSMFFDFSKYDRNISAYSAGVFYFINSSDIKILFDDTRKHIKIYCYENNNSIPICLDQPFLVYNSFCQNKYNNKLMKSYMENNPEFINNKIIYHFPGGPGHYSSKISKMTNFWNKMIETNIFDNRNDMIKYYCNKITNPKILEIGVFRGEFLEYIVNNCNIYLIDGIDIFTGICCSGDADGNNLHYYNVENSYLELIEKYKNVFNVSIYKADSVRFLKSKEDNYYDIIYIDADHSYDSVKSDLMNAFNKVKNNGYIMGHDYEMNMVKAQTFYNFGVQRAVDEFCTTYSQKILAKAYDGCVSFCIQINKI